ncbi:MAG: autotransporter outer membrane beta-barrel domain-containing protein [Selenomonas sp.]|uniref:autotransporter outer membrane beta-barrel domain-containing protein n=1 Tax=Selenomonas sp. TaxID=2053611 RepID=UPI0025D3198F|nr:autotransporter outer membrane beta-barrel domain-containing protein [Selenomonas sp.]MCR5757107.1 autotransporter outer membrane beta-barrel domain-containing protein [Selenomonas sp.]
MSYGRSVKNINAQMFCGGGTLLKKSHANGKKQWRRLALGVAMMTGCWQLGWMPMAEADEVKVTHGNFTATETIENIHQENSNQDISGSLLGLKAAPVNATGAYTITIQNNDVSFTGGSIGYDATPAWVVLGNGQVGEHPESYVISGNTITVTDGVTNSGIGALAGLFMYCNDTYEAQSITATNNSVTVSGGTSNPNNLITGAAIGTAKTSLGQNNHVTITGGNFTNSNLYIAGVWAGDRADYSDSLRAINNTVEISGGTFTSGIQIYGAGRPHATRKYFNETSQNKVTIDGGTFGDVSITGGMAKQTNSKANDNIVTIKSGTFSGTTDIYGGQGTTTNNNTVNIFNTMTINNLVGGSGTTSTGNTLNVGATGIQAATISGFQNINFFLPANVASGDTLLTVNGATSDLTGVTFGVAALSGATLAKGDTVNLLYNANGLTTDATLNTTASVSAPSGWTTDSTYDLSISKKDANTIIATVDGAGQKEDTDLTERMKSPVETRAAAVSLLNNGSDLLVSQGFSQAANAVAIDLAEKNKAAKDNTREGLKDVAKGHFVPYAAIGGFNMRVNSGSHVDNKGMGLNVGFVRELSNKQGKLLFGPVVEYGRGSYDSYLNDGTHGNGDSSYWGLGVMARQTNNDGLYYEGSVRGGNLKADYAGNLAADRRASYDSSSNYWAAHMGLGKVMELTHGNVLDCYMKYFYSHTAGDNVTATITNTTTGASATDTMNFDSVDSHRLRIGARLTHKLDNKSSLYGGLAYQHEFGGEARATYSGIAAPSPSIKGGSGMLELGWQVKPGGPVKIDLGATGWVGKQRGFSAQLGAMWTF